MDKYIKKYKLSYNLIYYVSEFLSDEDIFGLINIDKRFRRLVNQVLKIEDLKKEFDNCKGINFIQNVIILLYYKRKNSKANSGNIEREIKVLSLFFRYYCFNSNITTIL